MTDDRYSWDPHGLIATPKQMEDIAALPGRAWEMAKPYVQAPYQAMTYTRKPSQQSMEALGWMGKLNNAIDPVQAFGGYGNVLAMAVPMGAYKPRSFKATGYKGMPKVDLEGRPWQADTIKRPVEFPSFNRGEPGIDVGGGFYAADPKVASKFAELYGPGKGHTGVVYPANLTFKKPLVIDAKGAKAGSIQFGDTGAPFRDAVRSGKYDGIVIKNTADEGTIFVALKEGTVKSKTTGDALYGAAGAVGAAGLAAKEYQGE